MHLKYIYLLILLVSNFNVLGQLLNFEEVKLEQNTNNNLRVDAHVTISKPAHVYIQYTYTQNGVVYTETSAVSPLQKEHNITLIALRDSTLYQFRIFAFNQKNKIQAQAYELMTPVLPSAIKNFETPSVNRLENIQTYTLLNSVRGTISYFLICDAAGQVVWYSEYRVLHNVCNGWRWTKENTILQADCRTISEVDLFGHVLTEIDIDEPTWNLHHDVMKLRDGNILAIYTQPETADLSETMGDSEARVAVDGFLIINKEGEVVINWNAADHFNIQTAQPMGAYWNLVYGSGTVDWCHFNALEEDIDGSILISVSHWSNILKIDKSSGEVIWQLGEGGTLKVPSNFSIKQQHAITVLAPNRYLIFDNLGLKESSRALEFAVETNENRAFQFWEYVPEPSIVSLTRGNAQRLSNGNTLIYFPKSTGIIQEVDTNGELIWQVGTQRSGYRAYRIPYINKPHPSINFKELPQSICSNTPAFEIITEPANAYLTGEAIEAGMFNPKKAKEGINIITASFGTSLKEIEIEVWGSPKPGKLIKDNTYIKIDEAFESYQWYANDTIVEGATQQQYQPLAQGIYFVEVSNQNGCSAYSDTLNYSYVNVAENINDQFELIQLANHLLITYPYTQALSIEIFNLRGQSIEKRKGRNTYQINSTHFPAVYLLRIFDGHQFWVKKLMKIK